MSSSMSGNVLQKKIRGVLRLKLCFVVFVRKKISKLLDYTSRKGEDIADPWYTGNFDATYRDVKEGCEALLDECLLHL